MPILKSIKIESFKSILCQTIDLGQLNVFIGANGSGKSNFLEALGMLSSAISGEIEYSRFTERGMRLSSPNVFRSAFKNEKRKPSIYLEAKFSDFFYHVNLSAHEESNPWCYYAEEIRRTAEEGSEKIAGRSNRGATIGGISVSKPSLYQSVVTSAEALGKFTDDELFKIRSLKEFAIYAPSTPVLRGVSPDNSNKSPLGLYGGSLADALENMLENVALREELQSFFKLLDWYQTIGVTSPSDILQSKHVHTSPKVVMYKDKYMKKNFNELYAYDVSEGALYILFVIVLLSHQIAPNIFAIDNVDSCLNPGLITNLMSHITQILAKNKKKQIFLTTHNPTSLDGIDIFNEDHRLFVVKRGENGSTVFERISPPLGLTKEDWNNKYYGMKLSEIWLSGAIGGLPLKGF
jgi:predicted ATPase